MDGGLAIVSISVAMFIGCFVLGFIPLLFRLSERGLQFVTVLGAGLLCGTALAIILPEGVDLLQNSWTASSCSAAAANESASDTEEPTLESCISPRFLIGLALVGGFMFMFLMDQLGSYCSANGPRTGLIHSTSITATLGLVIHAAADGFALGAAMATTQVTVQVIVFFAVILHKAPAAFGLVSFLMHAGVDKRQIQGHLLAFSAAAPIFAISTYFIIMASGSTSQNRLRATGVGMLFSAGTFLYVATVHVLPEVSRRRQPQSLQLNHNHETGKQHLGILESLTLMLGTGLPVLLALGLQDD